MGTLFANDKLVITFTLVSGPCVPTGPVTLPRPGVIYTPSSKCSSPEGFLMIDKIQFVWNPGAPCPFAPAGPFQFIAGSGSLMGTSVKCQIEGKSIIRLNDSGTCSGQWLNTNTGSPVPCSCTMAVTNAGQTKVSGD
jgi:hypothetical protein